MFKFTNRKPTSELANVMAFLFAFFGSQFVFSKLEFNYNLFSDTFNFISFAIEFGTLMVLYFIGLSFFSWLYSKTK